MLFNDREKIVKDLDNHLEYMSSIINNFLSHIFIHHFLAMCHWDIFIFIYTLIFPNALRLIPEKKGKCYVTSTNMKPNTALTLLQQSYELSNATA